MNREARRVGLLVYLTRVGLGALPRAAGPVIEPQGELSWESLTVGFVLTRKVSVLQIL